VSSLKKKQINLSEEYVRKIAIASRSNPRNIINLINKINLIHTEDNDSFLINLNKLLKNVEKLTAVELKYLKAINDSKTKKLGLNAISSIINEDMNYLSKKIEPYLLSSGFIELTEKGRSITSLGIKELVLQNIDILNI
jgi:Holliday junction resolvasome RuvABC ATP-dependent DNA helicase subunit